MIANDDVRYIVVHCSATKPSQDIDVHTIDQWHRARGWSGVGYHGVITRDGVFQQGRWMARDAVSVGAHAYGYNRVSVGVCLIGGLLEDGSAGEGFPKVFRPAQGQTLLGVLAQWRGQFPNAEVLGHRDLSPDIDGDGVIERWEWTKACPCFDVREWCRAMGLAPEAVNHGRV